MTRGATRDDNNHTRSRRYTPSTRHLHTRHFHTRHFHTEFAIAHELCHTHTYRCALRGSLPPHQAQVLVFAQRRSLEAQARSAAAHSAGRAAQEELTDEEEALRTSSSLALQACQEGALHHVLQLLHVTSIEFVTL